MPCRRSHHPRPSDYFTDDVPAKAERYAASHEAWAITDSGAVTGFAVAARKSPGGTRQPGNPATRQPGNPATRQPGNPATRQQYTSPQSAQPDDKHVSQLQLTGTYLVTRDLPHWHLCRADRCAARRGPRLSDQRTVTPGPRVPGRARPSM